jgi:hypothetical protein
VSHYDTWTLSRAERASAALKAAETFLACHDAFLLDQSAHTAYAMRDAATGLRVALAEWKAARAALEEK